MKKIIIAIGEFLLAVAIGFAVTTIVGNKVKARKESGGGKNSGGVSLSENREGPEVTPEGKSILVDTTVINQLADENAVIDSLKMPIVEDAGHAVIVISMTEYSYTLAGVKASSADGAPLEYVLSSPDLPEFAQSNSTGYFTNLKPTSSGIYCLTIVNTVSGYKTSPVSIEGFGIRRPIKNYTAEQLAAVYMSGQWPNGNRNAFQARFRRGFTITYNGADTKSAINALPRTHQELFQKAKTGAWTNMTITDIQYDALGYIASFNLVYTTD